MNSKKTLANIFRRLNLPKIALSLLLFTALTLTTIFSSGLAIAADSSFILATSNRSETTYPTDDGDVTGLLYNDSDKAETLNSVDEFVNPSTQKKLLDPTQIPAVKQPILDRSDPNAKLLEKTGQMFDDAAEFSPN